MIVRSSVIGAFKKCPRLAYYTYVLGLRPRRASVDPDLFFGKSLHKGIEFYHNESLDTALDMLGTLDWPQHKIKTVGRARALLKIYAKQNGLQLLHVEKDFSFKIGPHTWKGRFDGIGEDSSLDLWVVESKSTLPYYLQLRPYSDQTVAYLIGSRVYYKNVRGVYINSFDPTKLTLTQIPLIIFKEDIDRWLAEIKLVLEHFSRCRTRNVYPTGSSCIVYNKECVFKSLCNMEESVRPTLIERNFIVDEKLKNLEW